MFVEEVLKALIGDVNEQLFEAVLLEVLEARHVKDTDRTSPAVGEQDNRVFCTLDLREYMMRCN